MSDDALLARWVDCGDAEAFTELTQRHAGLVYGTCRRILRDHHSAEDVAQECLLELARKAASIRTSVAGFLHTLAFSRARDRLRQDRAREQREAEVGAELPTATPANEPTWVELSPLVDAAVAELPEDERVPLILHFFEGLTHAEVAERMGCDRATVSRRIARAIEVVRAQLGRSGLGITVLALGGMLTAHASETAPPTLLTAAGKMALVGSGMAAPVSAVPVGAATSATLVTKIGLLIAVAASCVAGGVWWRRGAPPPAPNAVSPVAAPTAPPVFPIGVWLQDPRDAVAYRQAGINVFVGLWNGPTEPQLAALSAAGMTTICAQNDIGLRHLGDPTIAGWLGHADPDSVQTTDERGVAPPVPTSEVLAAYRAFKALDATRPVCLLFGHGVAWDDFPGRGARQQHPEDYREYSQGGDILGFRIYPVNNSDPVVGGKLWYVPRGVDHLRAWSNDAKPVWSWIECTKIAADSPAKPTPEQVRAEVWMSLIHGARGIVYFCHTLRSGGGDHAALLRDPVMLPAVTALNHEIAGLAPVLATPEIHDEVTVTANNPAVPVDVLVKYHAGATYLFAAAMRDGSTSATFAVPSGARVEVLGENRTLAVHDGTFSDHFAPYGVHLYRIPSQEDQP